jgi:transcription antitermination protein NusB
MANRHLLRTLIMQSLYESEFHPEQPLAKVAERQLAKGKVGEADAKYVQESAAGLTKRRKAIDQVIVENAPEWPLDQIASIDRAVLRLGIYEVLYSDDVPPKVAINEAVEIAKAFGGENSGSFVNGVLGTVYRASDKYDGNDDKTAKPAAKAGPKKNQGNRKS